MGDEPFADLAPDILRAEVAKAHDVLQLAAKVGRDGLGPVGHCETFDSDGTYRDLM